MKGTATQENRFPDFLPYLPNTDSLLEPDEQFVLEHIGTKGRRPKIRTVPGIVTDFERMDTDRRSEIVERVADVTGVDREEWVPTDDAVDWDRLRSQSGVEHDYFLDVMEERFERPQHMLMRLRIAPDKGMYFEPGDYIGLQLPETPRRAYSIANTPADSVRRGKKDIDIFEEIQDGPVYDINGDPVDLDRFEYENEIELCIRRIPDTVATDLSLTPRLYDAVEDNAAVQVRGAYKDDLELQDPSERDMVFMATGTGVAPLRSMIRHTFEEGDDLYDGEERDVWLFLGASWKDDIPYRKEFEELGEEYCNFHPVLTASREELLDPDWEGETAYIQHCLLTYLEEESVESDVLDEEQDTYLAATPQYDIDARIDPANTEVYLCGITLMANAVDDVIQRLDVDPQFYQAERFG